MDVNETFDSIILQISKLTPYDRADISTQLACMYGTPDYMLPESIQNILASMDAIMDMYEDDECMVSKLASLVHRQVSDLQDCFWGDIKKCKLFYQRDLPCDTSSS